MENAAQSLFFPVFVYPIFKNDNRLQWPYFLVFELSFPLPHSYHPEKMQPIGRNFVFCVLVLVPQPSGSASTCTARSIKEERLNQFRHVLFMLGMTEDSFPVVLPFLVPENCKWSMITICMHPTKELVESQFCRSSTQLMEQNSFQFVWESRQLTLKVRQRIIALFKCLQ